MQINSPQVIELSSAFTFCSSFANMGHIFYNRLRNVVHPIKPVKLSTECKSTNAKKVELSNVVPLLAPIRLVVPFKSEGDSSMKANDKVTPKLNIQETDFNSKSPESNKNGKVKFKQAKSKIKPNTIRKDSIKKASKRVRPDNGLSDILFKGILNSSSKFKIKTETN